MIDPDEREENLDFSLSSDKPEVGLPEVTPSPSVPKGDDESKPANVNRKKVDYSGETIQYIGNLKGSNPNNENPKDENVHRGTLEQDSIGNDTSQPSLPCRFGDYVLDKVLGRGGMGVVYLAHQVQLDRPVAIKMIRSGCLAGETEIHRFYAEARSAARLDHPNIVAIHQCGEMDGNHFFSMDYVPGSDLGRRIADGPMSPRAAAIYTRDIAKAIGYAHSQGVLHRDLKPANVLIDIKDQVVITDFGLAKLLDADAGLTQSGAAVGTPSYMSPEQADGKTASQAATTDVYSIGAILFALLTGKPPFQNSSAAQTIMDVIHKPAPDTILLRPDVPLDLDTIVAKCLQKEPSQRYPSAIALAEELDRFLRGEPIHSRPLSFAYRSLRWFTNVPLIAALIGFRSPQATEAHRWIQRAIIAFFLMGPVLLFASIRMQQWWTDQHIPSHIVIAGGIPGGVYSDFASGLAKHLKQSLDIDIAVSDTAGSNENLDRLLAKKADLAMLQATSVRSDRVAVVAPLYYEALHVIVRKDRSIKKTKDFKGHRIAVGLDDSGTRAAVLVVLDSIDLHLSDIDAVSSDWTALKNDATLDAAMVVIKPGHHGINDLLDTTHFQLLSIEDVQAISLDEPTFKPIELTERDYHSLSQGNIETLATTAFLATGINAPSRLVTECLKALYSEESRFEGMIPPKRAANWVGLPFHPASRAYYRTILE